MVCLRRRPKKASNPFDCPLVEKKTCNGDLGEAIKKFAIHTESCYGTQLAPDNVCLGLKTSELHPPKT